MFVNMYIAHINRAHINRAVCCLGILKAALYGSDRQRHEEELPGRAPSQSPALSQPPPERLGDAGAAY